MICSVKELDVISNTEILLLIKAKVLSCNVIQMQTFELYTVTA